MLKVCMYKKIIFINLMKIRHKLIKIIFYTGRYFLQINVFY